MSSPLRRLLVVLSIILAFAAMWLWWTLFDVSFGQLRRVFATLNWWSIPAILGLLVGHVALSAWRWSLIEVAIGGEKPRFVYAFAAGGLALGLGTVLPAPIVNVACRGAANRLSGGSGVRGAVSGGFDQVADFAVTVLLAIPAALALAIGDVRYYLAGAAVALVVGLAAVYPLPALARSPILPAWARRHAHLPLFSQRAVLFKVYAISALRLTNLTLLTVMVHFASGAGTVETVLVAVPLVTLAISVSMLPGAFGASEWSFSAVFVRYGLGSAEIVRFVLANRILLTLGSVAIAVMVVVFLLHRRVHPKPGHRET
jgi:hypothetical protein